MPVAINRVAFGGPITRDPEATFAKSGESIAKGSLAINRKTKDGQETTFVNFVAFGKTANVITEYVKKGDPIYIEGRLSIRAYEGKDGTKKSATEVIVDSVQLLGNKRRSEDDAETAKPYVDETDDEIPF